MKEQECLSIEKIDVLAWSRFGLGLPRDSEGTWELKNFK